MEVTRIEFDDGRGKTYRKVAEVMAFRSNDAFRFSKSWGVQECRAGSWVIVPLDAQDGPTGDLYGCDGDVFAETYVASPSLQPHRFIKKATVRAYQPGRPFAVRTELKDGHLEVAAGALAPADAWIVKAPGGEVYTVENEVFTTSYALVP